MISVVGGEVCSPMHLASRLENFLPFNPIPMSIRVGSLGHVIVVMKRHRADALRPSAGMEFEKVWQSLGADRERQGDYLRTVQPASLPSLFKQALTGPLLSSMLAALLSQVINADPGFGLEILAALSRVPRFELTAMCLPARERQQLKEFWETAAALMNESDAASFEGLRRSFRL